MTKETSNRSSRQPDLWSHLLPAKNKIQPLTTDELRSEERRRFLRNIGRLTTRIVGVGAMLEGTDLVAFGPDAGVTVALDAKEKAQSATREQIETGISPLVRSERVKALAGLAAVVIGYRAAFKSGDYEE